MGRKKATTPAAEAGARFEQAEKAAMDAEAKSAAAALEADAAVSSKPIACRCKCHRKRRASGKAPSEAQLRAREKMKAKMLEAKEIHKQNPGMKMQECVKKAWGK
jgi:hypothetical protein